MKKKLAIIIPCAVLSIIIFSAVLFMIDKDVSIGRCVVADNGSVLLIDDEIPVEMLDRSIFKGIYSGIETGDKALVIHSDVMSQSYPGQFGVYLCIRIGEGSVDDIPEKTMTNLQELGYIN